jgi:hypothetical protein
MRGWLIRIGIIAAIAVGGFFGRSFLSGNAGDLKVGDCFDPPTVATETVKDVPHHPCTDSHGAEVVFVGSYPTATDYPSDDAFQQFVGTSCLPAYQTYTGVDLLSSSDGDMAFFQPTPDGWSNGDRTVICYAVRSDGSSVEGSIRKP